MSYVHNSRALNTFKRAKAARKANRMLCVVAGVPADVPIDLALTIRAARLRLGRKGFKMSK